MSDSPSIDFPDRISAEGLELRRLRAPAHGGDATDVEAIDNARSRAAMRKIGAREAEIDPAPRLYEWDPERRSRSQYFVVEL